MKFPNPLLTDEPETALGPVAPGGDDFLSRVTRAILNFKEVLTIAKELRGIKREFGSGENADQGSGPPPPGPAFNMGKALAPLLTRYGDKTVGEIMENLSPMTLNQIVEAIKRAGFGR
ncbi:hypothetical protein ES708_11987 [subsurface metagenome]